MPAQSLHTILVTGAGGFVGTSLCDALVQNGHHIRRVQRSGAPGPDLWLVSDLARDDIPDAAFEGVDTVIHLAASLPGRHINADGTEDMAHRVAQQAARNGVRRVLHLSSIAARLAEEGDSAQRAYGVQKRAAEQAFEDCLDENVHLITLRPPVIYGPQAHGSFAALQGLVKRGLPLPLGAADAGRCYLSLVNLTDLITSIICADDQKWAAADRMAFEPCDGFPVPTNALVHMMAEAMDVRIRVVPFPAGLLKTLGRLAGKQDQIDAMFAPLDCRDTPSLKDMFGWSPPEQMPGSLSYLRP